MLFNINTLQWDDEILEMFNIPKCMLPKPVSNSEIYGYTEESLFGGPIPISGAAGDQQQGNGKDMSHGVFLLGVDGVYSS